MIFDLHCDTVWKIDTAREKGERISLQKSHLQIDQEKLLAGNYFAQCFAIFAHAHLEDPYATCMRMIDVYYDELKSCEHLRAAYTYNDILQNHKDGKISAILTMEDGAPIDDSFERLNVLYDRGVRMICLTWNYVNKIGHHNRGKFLENGRPDDITPVTDIGLTEFGKALVKEMNKKGIIVDVSHLSDAGFYDVISTSEKPIIASHSNARGLCRHIRNFTDNMLYKLADNGGVMGMNYAKYFLNNDSKLGRDTIPWVIEHIKYIKGKIGLDNIGLGSDFDGISTDLGLNSADQMPRLVQALEENGFTTNEIEKITYQNALRVFKDCLK
jgi:membrane dipeptidase